MSGRAFQPEGIATAREFWFCSAGMKAWLVPGSEWGQCRKRRAEEKGRSYTCGVGE
jgi:hypothetical protein